MTDVPANHVHHNGQHYPVNAHWHDKWTVPYPHLAGKTKAELATLADDLIEKSRNILTPLSKDERAHLWAINHHFNVRSRIDWLRGRDHREFGFGGVDQAHGLMHHHTCGCSLSYVWDNDIGPSARHHHTPVRVCDIHAEHAHDLALLHERVNADAMARDAARAGRK